MSLNVNHGINELISEFITYFSITYRYFIFNFYFNELYINLKFSQMNEIRLNGD